MGIAKRALHGIMTRSFRSISLILILVIGMIGILFSIYLESVIGEYQTLIRQQVGFCINLYSKEEDGIPDELAEMIGNKDFVLGYNAESSVDIIPSDFQNYIPKDVLQDNFDLAGDQSQVRLWGSVNTEYSTYFFQKQAELLEGRYPGKNSNEVLIDKGFADYNHLHISDRIHVPREKDGKEITLEVAGIYEINWKVSKSIMISNVNGFYQNIPYSYIFCDYGLVEQVADAKMPKSTYNFYTQSVKKVKKLKEYIEELNLDADVYEYSDLSEEAAGNFSNILVVLQNSSRNFLAIVNSSICCILFLITFLWMRDHCQEAGIYIVLGRNRFAIIIDYMIELIIMISIVFFILAILFQLVLNRYGNVLLSFFINKNAQGFQYQPVDMLFVNYGITWDMFLRSSITILLVLIVAAIFSSIVVLSYRPRKLFEIKN